MNRMLHRLFLPVLVFAALGIYILNATGLVEFPDRIILASYLSLGPLGVVGAVELGARLGYQQGRRLPRIGAVFGVAAFVIWELVMIIQSGSAMLFRDHIAKDLIAALPDGDEAARLIYLSVGMVQASMDVAFDVFFCLAIIVFSVSMMSHPAFGPYLGVYGIVAAGSLLGMNILTFPMPPAEVGMWDLGPLTAIWWVAVIVIMVRTEKNDGM